MGRSRQRVCLQEGLRLDLNRLRRRGFIAPGARTGPRYIQGSWTYTDDVIATGLISADLTDPVEGWLRIELGSLDQRLLLFGQERHFGGRQWYFNCPATAKLVSVVWKPPGAHRFASRHAWRRQVAYASQFESRHGRALSAAQAIRTRLGGPDWAGLDEFDPPKPKWMREATYQRLLEKAWAYEAIADERLVWFAARLTGRG